MLRLSNMEDDVVVCMLGEGDLDGDGTLNRVEIYYTFYINILIYFITF